MPGKSRPNAGLGPAALFCAAVLAACSGGEAPPPPADTTAAAAPSGPKLPPEVVDKTWEWIGLTAGAEGTTIAEPARYTVTFDDAGRVEVKADCNRGSSGYSVPASGEVTLQPITDTKKGCPAGSLSDRFVQLLGRVQSWYMIDGELYLETTPGTLRFRQKA